MLAFRRQALTVTCRHVRNVHLLEDLVSFSATSDWFRPFNRTPVFRRADCIKQSLLKIDLPQVTFVHPLNDRCNTTWLMFSHFFKFAACLEVVSVEHLGKEC